MKRILFILGLLIVASVLAVWMRPLVMHSSDAPAAVGAPHKDASGAYPLLVASLLAGDVTEFKPADVRKLEDAQEVTVDGVPQWRVDLFYTAHTKFGPFEVMASAFVKNGKVLKWIYTGSGEVIP